MKERLLRAVQGGNARYYTPHGASNWEKYKDRIKPSCANCGWYRYYPRTEREIQYRNALLAKSGFWNGYCTLARKPIGTTRMCGFWCFKHDKKQMEEMWTAYEAMKNHKPLSISVGAMLQERGLLPPQYANIDYKAIQKYAIKKERARAKKKNKLKKKEGVT